MEMSLKELKEIYFNPENFEKAKEMNFFIRHKENNITEHVVGFHQRKVFHGIPYNHFAVDSEWLLLNRNLLFKKEGELEIYFSAKELMKDLGTILVSQISDLYFSNRTEIFDFYLKSKDGKLFYLKKNECFEVGDRSTNFYLEKRIDFKEMIKNNKGLIFLTEDDLDTYSTEEAAKLLRKGYKIAAPKSPFVLMENGDVLSTETNYLVDDTDFINWKIIGKRKLDFSKTLACCLEFEKDYISECGKYTLKFKDDQAILIWNWDGSPAKISKKIYNQKFLIKDSEE